MAEERFLASSDQGEGWREEAEAVIADVQALVNSISISPHLPCNESGIYFNLETKEGQHLTVELSSGGFRISSSNSYDTIDPNEQNSRPFETIYALLDTTSPKYRESFSNSLAARLQALSDDDDNSQDNKMEISTAAIEQASMEDSGER